MVRRVSFDERGAVVGERVEAPRLVAAEQAVTGPTVKAVVAYAARLRAEADVNMRSDAYARPYYPSTASARRLSQRLGPTRALLRLRELALEANRRDRERDAESQGSLTLLAQRRERADRDCARDRASMSYGQRIDRAIGELSTVAAAPAAQVGGDLVHGGGGGEHAPQWPGDPAASARRIARDAARAVEAELDAARRRDLGAAA